VVPDVAGDGAVATVEIHRFCAAYTTHPFVG
jgi:hypothetical protein